MTWHFKLHTFIFIILIVFMGMISIISFISALSWINKPFPGFWLYKPPLVGSISVSNWPGKAAGLKMMDRVISMDGKAIQKGRDVTDAIRNKEPGTPVHYVFETSTETREITLPVISFGLRDFFLTGFLIFLVGLIFFILGIIVYLLKANTPTSWVFLAMCLGIGGYMVTAFDSQSSLLLIHFHYVALCCMAVPVFHLSLIFPEKKQIVIRFPWIQYLIYLPSLTLALAFQIYMIMFAKLAGSHTVLSAILSYPFLGATARIFLILFVLGAIVLMVHTVLISSNIQARHRARMIVLGILVAFLPSVISMMLVSFGKIYFPYNYIVILVIFFPASVAYAIVRHNLFEADALVRQAVGYVMVTAIVIGVYAVVSLTLNVFLGKYQLAQSRAFPILFALGIILIFNPLRNRVQAVVDRVFFRKEYDYGEIVEKIGNAFTSLVDLDQILCRLTKTFMEDMFINTSSVMLLNPVAAEYQVRVAEGEKKGDIETLAFNRNDPLLRILEEEKREVTKIDVLEDPKYKKVSENCAANFEALHASLMIPLVFQDQVIGALNLGEKKSGKFYNRQDIDLLRTLANQSAVAIENARLFQENLQKQRMEKELNIARDLQTSMLPSSCPEIDGFKIAAYSLSAREVGGDFYDFIEMEEDRIGMIIGDVTGKSVSGALVMSASRSIFRTLSEDHLSVGEIMIRANRRAQKDIRSGMFVALLYAVLDVQKRTLSLCNAGQIQPILFSSRTNDASLIETKGDTFPLGILEDVDYRETTIELEPGDKVVLYTDGIVEAMDDRQQIFGFERLLNIVQGTRSMTAESLLTKILYEVNEFAGEAAQHDDITVIVVSVEE